MDNKVGSPDNESSHIEGNTIVEGGLLHMCHDKFSSMVFLLGKLDKKPLTLPWDVVGV